MRTNLSTKGPYISIKGLFGFILIIIGAVIVRVGIGAGIVFSLLGIILIIFGAIIAWNEYWYEPKRKKKP